MSGFGSFPGGIGPAGSDPVSRPSVALAPRAAPAAAYFDLASRRTHQMPDGGIAGMHPIDQRAVLLVGTAAGALRSCPEIGHLFRSVLRGGGDPALQAKAEGAVAQALAPLLRAGDIVILAVEARGSGDGRVEVGVAYRNLRTGREGAVRG